MSSLKSLGIGAILLVVVPTGALPQTPQRPDPRIADLVEAGKLRIGVFPSFQYSRDTVTGHPRGLAIEIANALSSRMGLGEVVTLEYPTPPQVIACVRTGDCHAGFMLIDPARAAEVDFAPAFVRSDFTYLVPAGSPIRSAAEVDRAGIRIAAVRGHASTAALLRIIKQAQPVYADTYDPTFELLRSGNADAFASIREMLVQYSAQLPGSRVLEDSYQVNLAGIAVPKENKGRLFWRIPGRHEAVWIIEARDRQVRLARCRRGDATVGIPIRRRLLQVKLGRAGDVCCTTALPPKDGVIGRQLVDS